MTFQVLPAWAPRIISKVKEFGVRGLYGFRRSIITVGLSFYLGNTYACSVLIEADMKVFRSRLTDDYRALWNHRNTRLVNQTTWLQTHHDGLVKEIVEQKEILKEVKKGIQKIKGSTM